MKKGVALAVLAIVIIFIAALAYGAHHKSGNGVKVMKNNPVSTTKMTVKMTIASQEFKDGQPIPVKFTCKGENISPPLDISGVPATAKTLSLIMHDPDAPSGDYVHWVMWNIPSYAKFIGANILPAGSFQGQNSSGQNAYMGPCPPSGTHHYIFELYAVDKELELPDNTGRDQLVAAMNGHILAQAELTGLFGQ